MVRFSFCCITLGFGLLLGKTHQHYDQQGVDRNACDHGDEESEDIVHRAEDSDNGAAVHDVIRNTKHASQCTSDGANDHVGGDNLQRTRSGKRYSAFCDTEEAHE